MITVNGKEYPTKVGELTLEQWANLSEIVRVFEKEPLLQMEGVLKAIGVPDKEIENVPVEFSKELSASFREDDLEHELHEEIAGYKLTLPSEFTIGMGKVIDKLNEYGNATIALVAFFYRDERLTVKEHHDKAHIKHKMKVLKDEPASKFVYSVGEIMKYLTTSAKGLQNEIEGTNSDN